MRIIGIDPGASGALVCLDEGIPVEWEIMPTMKVGSATRVNPAAVCDFIGISRAEHIYVEHVGAMPGQGVASMFNFGHSVGTVMGVIGSMGLPCTLVMPAAWKKAAGLIGTDKDAARARAISLWPTWKELHKKGKGQALADAALIARSQL